VNWDNDVDANQQIGTMISPWEIEPIGPVIGSGSSTTAGLKRAKITRPCVNMDFPIPSRVFDVLQNTKDGNGCPDSRESASFHEVLQGQEVTRLTPPISVGVAASHFSENSEIKGKSADANNIIISEFIPGSRVRTPQGKSDFSFNCTGFSESVGFQKVLQGQEVFSKFRPFLGAGSDAHGTYGVYGRFDGLHAYHTQSRLPGASLGYVTLVQQSLPSVQAFPPSSVLMLQGASSKNLLFQRMHSMNCQGRGDHECYSPKLDGSKTLHREDANSPVWPTTGCHFTNQQHKMVKVYAPVLAGKSDLENERNGSRKGCMLFGFSLTEKIPVPNLVDPPPPVSQTKTDVKADITFSTSMPQMCPSC
ncbi:hypothetical protein B296_00028332, partial [Ensete ventricosum]